MDKSDEVLREIRGMAAEIGKLRVEIGALREEVRRIKESPRRTPDYWDPNDFTPDPSWSRGTETHPSLSKEYYGDDERSAIRSAYENVPVPGQADMRPVSEAVVPVKTEAGSPSGTPRPPEVGMEDKKKRKEKKTFGTFRKNKK